MCSGTLGWEWYFLHSQAHSQRFTFPLQKYAIAWSPSGNKLATCDKTGLVDIRDVRTGLLEKSLKGCPGKICLLSWSPDGKYLAAGSDRKVVVIWEVESTNIVRQLRGYAAREVDWNPDSVRLAAGGKDGTVYVWNTRTGERLSSLFLNSGPLRRLDWHPDGVQLVASGGRYGKSRLKVWDTNTEIQTMRRDLFGDVSFSPNGKHLMFGRSLIDFDSKELLPPFYDSYVYASSWSPDGRQVAGKVHGNNVNIWDVESGALLSSIAAHESSTYDISVAWSPAGRLLATSGKGQAKVWDTVAIKGNPRTFSTPGKVYALSVAFSPDGRFLLGGTRYGWLKMWDLVSGQEKLSLRQGLTWHRTVAFSPDGKRFAANASLRHGFHVRIAGAMSYEGERVVIHDADTGRQLLEIGELDDEVRSLDWSPDGKTLAVGFRTRRAGVIKCRVKLFNTDTGEELATSSYTDGQCNGIAWSPDGSRLAASANASIRVWDALLRKELVVATGSRGDPGYKLNWSPDGQHVSAGFGGGSIWIWDATTWTPIHILEGHGATVDTVAWHPWMPRLASGGRDGTVRVWDTATGREVCTLDAPGDDVFVNDVAWSPDGLRLASASFDGIVRIWDGSSADRYLKRHGDLRHRAFQLLRNEKHQEAIEVLERLRRLHPQELELKTRIDRGRWLWAAKLAVDGETAQSVAIFDQLIEEAADVPDYRLRLPGELFAAEQHEAAIDMAQKFVAEFPMKQEYRDELAFLYESRATQLCQAGEFNAAGPILRKLADEFPDRPDFRGQLVFDMAQADRFEETIQTLETLAEAFNGKPDYRPPLARRLSAADEHGLAASIYEQLMADYPDALEYQALHKSELAYVLIADDRLDEAIELVQGPELRDAEHASREPLGRAYRGRAAKYLDENDLDKAIADLTLAFELQKVEEKSHVGYELALAQLAEGRVEDYRTTCAQMLEQFGGSKAVTDADWLAWSCVLAPAATSDFAIPISAAEVALSSDAQSVSYLTTLGAILLRAEEYETAIVHLAQASDLAETASNSSLAYTWYFLAMAHHYLEQSAVAKEWLSKANTRAQEELGTDQEPKDALWNRRLTLDLLRQEAEALLGTDADDASQEPR